MENINLYEAKKSGVKAQEQHKEYEEERYRMKKEGAV